MREKIEDCDNMARCVKELAFYPKTKMVSLKGSKQRIDMIISFLKVSVGLKFGEWIEGQEWGGVEGLEIDTQYEAIAVSHNDSPSSVVVVVVFLWVGREIDRF